MAESKLHVATSLPETYDAEGYEALEWVEIGKARNNKEEEHQAKVELGVIVEDRER